MVHRAFPHQASVAANPGFAARCTLLKTALSDRSVQSDLCILSTNPGNQGNARLIPLHEQATEAEIAAGTCEGR